MLRALLARLITPQAMPPSTHRFAPPGCASAARRAALANADNGALLSRARTRARVLAPPRVERANGAALKQR